MTSTSKVLWETEYEKAVQTTDIGKDFESTSTMYYRKVFHISYKGGFIWKVC